MAKICFFARVRDRSVLSRVEFYAQDLRILRELGHEVVVATKLRELVSADLYYCWWWTYAFVPLAVAKFLRRPLVISGVFDEWMYNTRPLLHRWLMSFALRSANANVFVSELETRIVPARLRTANPIFAPCIVDTESYSPSSTATQRELLVLTVAWLHKDNVIRKGIAEVIRAAVLVRQQIPMVRFVIVGERASGFRGLEALARELGVDDIVSFPGILSREEKIDLMRRCGAFLQPSLFEGFGLAVLEAMSCGSAVIVSCEGALPEVVGNAGMVLATRSPREIADAVCRVLSDPTKMRELGAVARARAVDCFSYARRRDALRQALDDCLSQRS